jgi:hypothetical protein
MRRAPPQIPRRNQGPGYWINETSGVLRPAIVAYLREQPLSEAHVSAIRAYLRQWIAAEVWVGYGVGVLRRQIDQLDSREAIHAWLDDALKLDIDPL